MYCLSKVLIKVAKRDLIQNPPKPLAAAMVKLVETAIICFYHILFLIEILSGKNQ